MTLTLGQQIVLTEFKPRGCVPWIGYWKPYVRGANNFLFFYPGCSRGVNHKEVQMALLCRIPAKGFRYESGWE